MKSELVSQINPKSPISEIFKNLRTNIQFMNSNKSLKSLLVTSTMASEGKTWVSSNLAVAFAQAGKRVLIIDADMRKGRLHDIFGIMNRPGLSNFLSGVNDEGESRESIVNYIKETDIPNLYVIPAGNTPPNPSELLIRPQMSQLIKELKEECDLIILDGTPCKLVTDSVALSRIVDSTLIVASHNQTKKNDLENIVKNIQNVGGNILGVVYNRAKQNSKEYNQKYYYAEANPHDTSARRNRR